MSTRQVTLSVQFNDATSYVISTPAVATAEDIGAAWVTLSGIVTAPAGATTFLLKVQTDDAAVGETHFLDAAVAAEATYVYDVAPTITGVPSALASERFLGGWIDTPSDIRPALPTSFCRSAFRVVRDPAIVTDDSGNTLGTQVYDHGAGLAWLLGPYLKEVQGELSTWPPTSDFKVVPVTGTSAVNDGNGWHGMTAVTWPGSSVGVGTIRQIVAGDEGSTRKVAAILDLLAGLTSTQRNTIKTTFQGISDATWATAVTNLHTAKGGALDEFSGSLTTSQRRCRQREFLNMVLAESAITADPAVREHSDLYQAVAWGIAAVTALEAGLVGATFTSGNYTTLTDPIDAVIAMPSGY